MKPIMDTAQWILMDKSKKLHVFDLDIGKVGTSFQGHCGSEEYFVRINEDRANGNY